MDWAEAHARFVQRRAVAIVLVALALAVVAGLGASRLRLDQRLRALLPPDVPSIQRLDELRGRVGNPSDLLVAIRSPSREANVAFAGALADALSEREDMRWVLHRQDRAFFEDRALLYASLHDLLELRTEVILEIRRHVAREAYGTFDDEDPDDDGGAELEARVDDAKSRYGLASKLPEYFEADEGRLVVVKARPEFPDTDIAYARRLSREVTALAQGLGPSRYHDGMEITLEGSYAQHQGRVQTLRDSVVQGSTAALGAMVLVIAVYFRSARAVVLLIVPLVGAVVGALAFAWLAFGKLNLVSAFIFAVLLGLGIDFGIHILARYRDERRLGYQRGAALATVFRTAGKATAAAATGTGAAFAVLAVARFQGFAQFGIVAAVGIALALVAALVVMPALLVVLDGAWPWEPGPRLAIALPRLGNRSARVVAVATLAIGLIAAGYGARAAFRIPFEYDLAALGPVHRPVEPERASYRDAVGKAETVAPAVAMTQTLAQTRDVQRQLDALMAMNDETFAEFVERGDLPAPQPAPEPDDSLDDDQFGDEDFDDPRFVALGELAARHRVAAPDVLERLSSYGPDRLRVLHDRLGAAFSIYRFVPELQREKLAVIADIRGRIDGKIETLPTTARKRLDRWYGYLQVTDPVTLDNLPGWLQRLFADSQHQVVIATRGPKADIHNARRIYEAFAELDTDSGRVRVAADFFVIPEIVDAIARDGPVVVALATLVLLATAALAFRGVAGPLAVAAVVVTALAWLAASTVALGWKANLFNIIALPLLVGMGQDDAIHLLARLRERPSGRILTALVETGGAIFLTTATTICGFAGILFANHRGLLSLAWTTVLGMAACFVASVVLVPSGVLAFRWIKGQ